MTAFTEEIVDSLRAPLAREHVKERDQGRSKVSYIEGWHVIAEANRIFGFDGWTRETIMSECCHAGDYEKAVYQNGQRTDRTVTSFRCSYRARVRVTALGIVREGSGHGHGFADNPGEAHESAEKEAETDAMKRALMTFGNPFGLALYDKKQAEVEPVVRTAARSPSPPRQPQKVAPETDPFAPPVKAPHPNAAKAEQERKRIKASLLEADKKVAIDGIIAANGPELKLIRDVHAPAYEALMSLAEARTQEFQMGA